MLRLSRLVASAYLALALAAFGLSVVIGPLGYAPFPLAFGAAAQPVTITLAYSGEKDAWLREAARRFAASGARVGRRAISVQLQAADSRALTLDIVDERSQPTAVLPASSLEIARLRAAWAQRKGGELIGEAPVPLVASPLVLVGWKQRTQVLWPNGPGDLWAELHDAAGKGWGALGHPEWGDVKLGHTRPNVSASGVQTLALMAYDYHKKAGRLSAADVRDDGFRQWLQAIEGPARFSDDTDALMTDMLRFGPSTYDLVAVYESVAAQSFGSAQSRVNELQIFYPPQTILSDHPYAVLDAPWVSPEQREAALLFRDYLRSPEMQALAATYGFRPADGGAPATGAGSPFERFRSAGLRAELGPLVEQPAADAADALAEVWQGANTLSK
jgi:ABC-type Fe3+ transport system substrate-binding protein